MNDYKIVREAVLGMYSADQDGLYGFKDEALAALDRIEAKNLKQAPSLLEAWAACESLQAENERLAFERAEFEVRYRATARERDEAEAENERLREALREIADYRNNDAQLQRYGLSWSENLHKEREANRAPPLCDICGSATHLPRSHPALSEEPA